MQARCGQQLTQGSEPWPHHNKQVYWNYSTRVHKMAPMVDEVPVVVFPWPVFTVFGTDGLPLIGGKLYSYDSNTTTPRSTYSDPFFTNANPNPTLLNSEGQAIIYLDGYYNLRLYDEVDVLLWSVDSFTFSSGVSPSPGLVQVGSSEVTLSAVDGEVVLQGTGLAPAGYRLLGLTSRVLEEFGTSHGLTALALGDAVVSDRYGVQATLTVGALTAEQQWHSDTEILTAQPYNLLVSARGGTFDSAGQIACRLVWQTLGDVAVPGTDPSVITYGSADVTLTASDGALQLTASGLAPANCRLLGLTTEVLTAFGTSRGLTALALGDDRVTDRWGSTTALSAETTTNLREARSDTQIIAPAGYTVLVSAIGGTFDAQGEIQVRLYWATLTPI
jgi:hypothetical protein